MLATPHLQPTHGWLRAGLVGAVGATEARSQLRLQEKPDAVPAPSVEKLMWRKCVPAVSGLEMFYNPADTFGFAEFHILLLATPIKADILCLHTESVPWAASPPVAEDVQAFAVDPWQTARTHLELPLTLLIVGIPSPAQSAGHLEPHTNLQC